MSADDSPDEFEPNERELDFLASARRGLSPTEADAARISAAIANFTEAPPAPAPSPRTALPARIPASGTWWKLGLAALVAAGTGVAGYQLGFEAGRTTLPSAVVPQVQTTRTNDAPSRTHSASATGKTAEAPPARVEHVEIRRVPASSAAALATNAAPVAASSLEEETRMVARIERALRDHNARFALGLLGELDRSVPGGQLKEERDAARVLAHCQLEGDSAAALRAQFTKRYPRSAYLARIDGTCRALTPSESAAP